MFVFILKIGKIYLFIFYLVFQYTVNKLTLMQKQWSYLSEINIIIKICLKIFKYDYESLKEL